MALAHSFRLNVSKWKFELTLSGLMALTLIALLLPGHWLEHSLIIAPENYQFIYTNDDRVDGGTSQARLIDKNGYTWECDLSKANTNHPFCGLEIVLGKDRSTGVDLSKYQALKLWLQYEGPTESVRVNLRNANPAYFKEQDPSSTKFNQIEINKRLMITNEPLEFALDNFSVAEWWLNYKKIPPQLSHVELDNVIVLEVSSGNYSQPGYHRFELLRVEFHGYYFTTENWYLCIIIFWLSVIFGYILYRSLQLSNQLKEQKNRENELIEINQILDSRSRRLDLQSKTDHLTGVFNRQGLEEALQTALSERRENQNPLSLIMLDLDHFKSVNDSHGHLVGDEVLTQVAALVQKNVRRNDILARWGGEEFVLLCKGSTAKEAACLAEKVRELISQHPFPRNLKITASFGVADIKPDQTLDALFRNADLALYTAKNSGRNRVVSL
jgi:diguanylate cyclase (GGDEF)-like protein